MENNLRANEFSASGLSATAAMRQVLVTGGTGYLGRAAIPKLIERGHRVRALVRAGSERKLASGCEAVIGDALDARSIAAALAGCDTLVQLVGTPKPAPWKAESFRAIDERSCLAALEAAREQSARGGPSVHFVYLSVAQPAPVMKAYTAVRARCEAAIRASGLDATFLRPWYVIGPGHRWPIVLAPIYGLLGALPATHASAERLALVALDDLVEALVHAVETPITGVKVIDAPAMRSRR